ncbi:outer membrane beta-barrel protein [Adhaeribacter sp. BT258]|uniref:Outer membrane beta-barrel protein n=1 Tax=Adhaeribacter terrigena TaxID=2793070 RepID=A0ABS1C3Y0_9BACT|nr:outer membrane beta-barrel protein [Adhaeribacter terrigena]MBK0404112.1 outer membrane beta-barrel protein [Adhaeribacter terrigena]
MNYLKLAVAALLCIVSMGNALAQRGKVNYEVRRFWIVGLGINGVDDSGTELREPLRIGNNWNIMPVPSKLFVEKHIYKGLSVQLNGSYNKYKAGKQVNLEVNKTTQLFYAVDATAKFDLNYLFGPTKWFDPYVGGGYGFTSLGPKKDFSSLKKDIWYNHLGFGANMWVTNKIGVNLESMGKFSFSGGATSYKQHSISVIYKFGGSKLYGGRFRNSQTESAVDHLNRIMGR